MLHDSGLRPGDSFALIAENGPRHHECYWAGLRSGLYLTAINIHLSDDEQIYILRDCGAKVLIVSATMADLAGRIAEAMPEIEVRLAFGGPVARYDDYETALAAASRTWPRWSRPWSSPRRA